MKKFFEKRGINLKKEITNIGGIMLGTLIMAMGYSVFFIPSKVVSGGFSGAAALLYNAFGINISVTLILMNLPLIFFALKRVGKRFIIFAAIGLASFSLFAEIMLIGEEFIMKFINFGATDNDAVDKLLFGLYGGVVMGVGTGLVIKFGGSTGGSDLLAILVNKTNPNISVGAIIFAVDLTVIIINSLVFNDVIIGLYSLVAMYVASRFLDGMLDGFKQAKAVYIISEKYEEISDAIMKRLHRGVTALSGKGMYTKAEKNLLMVIVPRAQFNELKLIANEIDPRSFMICLSAKEVLGEGFQKYEPPVSTLTSKTRLKRKASVNIKSADVSIENIVTDIDIVNAAIDNAGETSENNTAE